MVTIPDIETLSESQRLDVYNKTRYRLKWVKMKKKIIKLMLLPRQLHTAKAIASRLQFVCVYPVNHLYTNTASIQIYDTPCGRGRDE